MPSLITGGHTIGCDSKIGGVSAVYMADFASTLVTYDNSGNILAIDAPNGLYKFDSDAEVISYNESGSRDSNTGVVTFAQDFSLVFPQLKDNEVRALEILSSHVIAFVVDELGRNAYLGKSAGLITTRLSQSMGNSAADLNGYRITMNGLEPKKSPILIGDLDTFL